MAMTTLPREQYHPFNTSHSIRNLLLPIQCWMNGMEIKNAKTAHLICQIVPSRCPFERDIKLLGHTIHIPALCRINPLYEEIVALRLRSLTYLSEVCGENVTQYTN